MSTHARSKWLQAYRQHICTVAGRRQRNKPIQHLGYDLGCIDPANSMGPAWRTSGELLATQEQHPRHAPTLVLVQCNPTKPCIMIGSTKLTTRERSTTCPLFSRRASARIWLAWLVRCPTGLPAWPIVLAQVVYCFFFSFSVHA